MMLVQLDKLLGILPLSVLFCNFKNWILCKWPSSRGISLWKLLFWGVRFLKKLKFPIYGEMEPTNFRYCKSNTVTLWCQRPQVAPFHWHKWMLSFQEFKAPSVEVGRVWLELPSPIHSYKPNTSSIRKPSSTRIIIPSKADLYIYILGLWYLASSEN